MSDTSPPLASTKLDLDPLRTDGDGMDPEPCTTTFIQKHVPTLRKRVSPGTRIDEDLSSSWPSFTTSQVIIRADNPIQALHNTPQKVRVAACDAPLFFKPYHCGHRRTAERELKAYTHIRQANLSQLRNSTLFGLVYDDDGLLLGLLLHYIDCKASTLQHAVTPGVSLSMRQYWAADIEETLAHLHEAGIIW
ncbi:hypothetical protein Q7P35_003748 [Cladosporium inversicolor]